MHSDIIMMDKNHLQLLGRGRAKTTFPRPAPNHGAQLCTDLPPFPEQHAASQHIPLPALQLRTDTPRARILLTSRALCNLPISLFFLLLQLRDAASVQNCVEMTMPTDCKASQIHLQVPSAPPWSFSPSQFLMWGFLSAHNLLDAALCQKVI